MTYIAIALSSFLLLLLIYQFKLKFSFLNEAPKAEDRKLHTDSVSRIGGIIFFSNIVLIFSFTDTNIQNVLLFSFLILMFGLFEDVYKNISKYFRLLILVSLVSLFVDFNNFVIDDFDNYYLNSLFESRDNLKILFSVLSLILLINAFNFIDGLNGLILGISILILTTFAFKALSHNNELETLMICLIVPILILFFINFVGGVVLTGDGGSYFLGFIIGCSSILMSNYEILNSFEIACIIFYPVMEFVCTVIRRVMSFSNPLKPDGLHLHQLLFKVMFYKLNNKFDWLSSKNINSLSSLIIIVFVAILLILHHQILKNLVTDTIIFIIFCSLYLLLYNQIVSYCSKNNLFRKDS